LIQDDPDILEDRLAPSDLAEEQGARVLALFLPSLQETLFSFRSALALAGLPGWMPVMQLAVPERMEAFRDPNTRVHLANGAAAATGTLTEIAGWAALRVVETFCSENADLVGRLIGDVAAERGTSPFDTVVDIALVDELRTVFSGPPSGDDPSTWELRSR